MKYSVVRVITPQEYADYKAINDALADGSLDWRDLYIKEEYAEQLKKYQQIDWNSTIPTLSSDRSTWVNPNEQTDFYWLKDNEGRLNMKDHPLTNGSIPDLHAQVPNPVYDPSNPDSPKFVPKYYNVDSSVYTTPMTEAERQRAMKQKGSGWVPAFSATVNFTDYSRAYLRYTETLRYPSIFEGTYGFSTAAGSFNRMGYGWRPEHAKNWEVGYIHDLTGLLPKMKKADFRINYFHNKTKKRYRQGRQSRIRTIRQTNPQWCRAVHPLRYRTRLRQPERIPQSEKQNVRRNLPMVVCNSGRCRYSIFCRNRQNHESPRLQSRRFERFGLSGKRASTTLVN